MSYSVDDLTWQCLDTHARVTILANFMRRRCEIVFGMLFNFCHILFSRKKCFALSAFVYFVQFILSKLTFWTSFLFFDGWITQSFILYFIIAFYSFPIYIVFTYWFELYNITLRNRKLIFFLKWDNILLKTILFPGTTCSYTVCTCETKANFLHINLLYVHKMDVMVMWSNNIGKTDYICYKSNVLLSLALFFPFWLRSKA